MPLSPPPNILPHLSARLLPPRLSILTLILEIRYTLSRLQADPQAAFCVPLFQSLRDECTAVQQQEFDLQEAISNAQANIDIADENIDAFASRLSKAVLTITKDDRSHPLYVHFFNKKPLSTFQRPKLGAELEAMRSWPDALASSPFPALQAMTKELSDLIVFADKAVAARADAAAQNRAFRDIRARRQLFDKVNAARKQADGDLTKLAINTPGLPSDYASKFFRAAPVDGAEDEPTIDSVTEEIADLEAKLAAAKDLLAKLQQAAEDAKKVEADKASDEAALAALEAQEAELAKQKAALQQKLSKK